MRDFFLFFKVLGFGISRFFVARKRNGSRKRRNYKLVVLNGDFKSVFELTLSHERVYVLVSTMMVVGFALSMLLFVYTPVRYLLPEYRTYQERKDLYTLRKKIDSLEAQFHYNERFIKAFQACFAVQGTDTSSR